MEVKVFFLLGCCILLNLIKPYQILDLCIILLYTIGSVVEVSSNVATAVTGSYQG